MRRLRRAMTRVVPPPEEPSNRWPWIALGAGVLVVLAAVVIFFLNRSNNVNINVPTPNPAAASGSPSPPPTLVPPTLLPSASLAPTATATSTGTPTNTPVPPSPTATPVVIVVTATPVPAAAAPAAVPGSPVAATPVAATPVAATPVAATPVAAAPTVSVPTSAGSGSATSAATPVASTATSAAAPAGPTPFAGQVSPGGGIGNTRADIDAAYGAPTGQTPNGLVVYRKNNFEYHVGFVPDLNGRAALIAQLPIQTAQLPALPQAQAEAHRLLPTDAQPPNPTPEGNAQFALERYTSQLLAQVFPANLFAPGGAQPGQFQIVYVKDASGNVSRWILGPGNDPNGLIAQGT